MSGSHEKLPWLFWAQLILVAIVGTLYLLAPSPEKHGEADAHGDSGAVKTAADNLKPVGTVAVKSDASTATVKTRSGEAVYTAACSACHNAGVANAPKPDDKAAWEPRIAQGMDGLLNVAINGKGAMPPRGGNPAVTDAELKAAILYMTKKAGFDLDTGTQPTTTSETKPDTSNDQKADATSPSTTATPPKKEPEPAKVAINTPPTEPQKLEAPQPVAAPNSPTPPTPPAETIAAVTTPVMKASEPVVNKPVSAEGEKLYKSTCFSCHAAGVAGAPKLDDKAAWAPRLAAGNDVLYNSAIKGKGIMPPKGGNMGLSDEAVKLAVDYMISQAQ